MTEQLTEPKRDDVPGGRCYWCGSQDHAGDDCAEAQRIMDECRERYQTTDAPPKG